MVDKEELIEYLKEYMITVYGHNMDTDEELPEGVCGGFCQGIIEAIGGIMNFGKEEPYDEEVDFWQSEAMGC